MYSPDWDRIIDFFNSSRHKNEPRLECTVQWVCNSGHHNSDSYKDITGRCSTCGELVPEVRRKPHYKWSWKLNKAVRL